MQWESVTCNFERKSRKRHVRHRGQGTKVGVNRNRGTHGVRVSYRLLFGREFRRKERVVGETRVVSPLPLVWSLRETGRGHEGEWVSRHTGRTRTRRRKQENVDEDREVRGSV